MNPFFMNTILALAWAAVSGSFTLANILLGFVLGFLVMLITRQVIGAPNYGKRLWQIANLIVFFLIELIKANLRVALDVLTPGVRARPGVLAVPLDVQTDAEIALLSNLITLTPGTLTLDISTDRRVLYMHAMYIDDPEAVRQQIKQGFERRVIEVLR